MADLTRRFNKDNQTLLLDSSLFKDHLLKDLSEKVPRQLGVFPAVRNNRIDFYYRGGKLFEFKNGKFKTHYKYASVIDGAVKDYLDQENLRKHKLISSFKEGYKRIKENCSRYSGVEAEGASELYGKHSYLLSKENVVVLDIEVQFSGKGSRIDLLVYNKKERKLRFYELKHFSNKELWSVSGSKPKVTEQIKKYKDIIDKDKMQGSILNAYKSYVNIINDLFKLEKPLPSPSEVDDHVALLWFGYDSNQTEKAQELLFDDNSLEGIPHYAIGNINKCNMNNLWKGTK